MKHEIQTRHFPVRLVIDIETEEDLCDLLARLNAAIPTINGEGLDYKFGASRVSYNLWEDLEDLAADFELLAEDQE